jgi:hypothetical protein
MGKTIVADKLRAAGLLVEVHADHFVDGEKDEVWLAAVGKKRWIVVSKDDAIRRREIERQALVKARVRALFLASCDTTGVQNAEIILRALSRIERMVVPAKGSMIMLVHADGRLLKG